MALDRQDIIARLEEGGSRDFSGLDLSGADLSRLDLRGANLSRADLSAADLRWTVLDGADLDSAVLRRADARWALLRGAALRNTDLVRANFAWADLTGADMSGADLDAANLESATLTDAVLPSPARRPGRAARTVDTTAAAPLTLPVLGGITVPRPSPAAAAAAFAALAALVWVWGWLFRRAYFEGGFGIEAAGLVALGDTANLTTGLLRVIPLQVGALLAIPLFFIGLVFIVALVAVLPFLLVTISERVLRDVVRPGVRPLVIAGLYVALTVAFVLILPPALSFARETTDQAAPAGAGLSVIYGVFASGGAWVKLGLLAVLGLVLFLAWIGWRLFSIWLADWEVPLSWRLRYPSLNAAVVQLRESRFAARSEPLTAQERRNGSLAAGALVLLLGFLLTDAGRVYAYGDMCDGGDLPRGQLFVNSVPSAADPRLQCQRLVAQTDTEYFVFFPSQSFETVPGDPFSREAIVSAVQQQPSLMWVEAAGDHDCPTCESAAEVKEGYRARVVIDPNEIETEGRILDQSGDLLTLDAAEEALAAVRLGPNTSVTRDGVALSAAALTPGVHIRATGRPAVDAPILEARLVEILEQPAIQQPPPLVVDTNDPTAIVISGSGYTPGNQVAVGLAPVGTNAPQVPLTTATVGTDGTFSIVVRYNPELPTGAAWQVVARDAVTGQYATGPWLTQAPPPTPTPPPSPTPRVVEEETPQPGEGTATTTPEAQVTNTPLPTPVLPPGSGGDQDCTPDTFEPDWPRGFEKEVFIGFGEGLTTDRNFCGRGPRPRNDVDLAYFFVKAGRWYRVYTTDLAPGVDTVLAVGDLSPSTDCRPAGCWNDDRAALTFESEVAFRAVEDGRAMITVDNRGGAFGDDATYKLGVAEFLPEPTSTPTLAPTRTSTPTPTATRTPLPYVDLYEPNDRCSQAFYPLLVGEVYSAVIDSRLDEDWFKTVPLAPGRYRIEMQPPDGEDYDVTLNEFVNQSRNDCPVLSNEGRTAGEGRLETINFTLPAENDGAQFGIRVFSRFRDIYFNEHLPYLLTLIRLDGTPVPTGTNTPVPTVTATPTITPTPPTPDSGIFPRPSVTPTATVTPTAAALRGGGA